MDMTEVTHARTRSVTVSRAGGFLVPVPYIHFRVFQPHRTKQTSLPLDFTAPDSPLTKHLNKEQSRYGVLAKA